MHFYMSILPGRLAADGAEKCPDAKDAGLEAEAEKAQRLRKFPCNLKKIAGILQGVHRAIKCFTISGSELLQNNGLICTSGPTIPAKWRPFSSRRT